MAHHHERLSKEELVRIRATALAVQQQAVRPTEEIWEQARREIEREAKTLDGEPGTSDKRPARLA